MNDLTNPPNSPPSKPTTTAPGPVLSGLLDSDGSLDLTVRQILDTPELLAETRAVLPTLARIAKTKAGQDGVRRVIAKRFELYPQPQRTEAQWDAWWADYFDVLSDVPLASLEAGMRAYVSNPDSEFMPKPGKLRELAFSAPCRSLMRYYRATRVVQLADENLRLQQDIRPPAPQADVKEMLAEFQARMGVGGKRELPSIAGVPDERGITPQMREVLARRAEERRP